MPEPTVYRIFDRHLFEGKLNLAADPLSVLLVTADYVPDRAHATVADIARHELKIPGYERLPLPETRLATGLLDDLGLLADAVRWPRLARGVEIGGAVVYKRGRTDRDSPLLVFFDLKEPLSDGTMKGIPTAGTALILEWSPAGLLAMGSHGG